MFPRFPVFGLTSYVYGYKMFGLWLTVNTLLWWTLWLFSAKIFLVKSATHRRLQNVLQIVLQNVLQCETVWYFNKVDRGESEVTGNTSLLQPIVETVSAGPHPPPFLSRYFVRMGWKMVSWWLDYQYPLFPVHLMEAQSFYCTADLLYSRYKDGLYVKMVDVRSPETWAVRVPSN